MPPLKIAAITLALLGLIEALIAARYWLKASKTYIDNPVASISDVPELHIHSTQVAFNKASQLNSVAAIWTGTAAVFSAVASVLGVLG
jgi:hypothetical protein